jgi:hypothetical protein
MIADTKLYNEVKREADTVFEKPSAYKSGWIVKTYKQRGGEYVGDKPINKGIGRWFKEEWKDIAGLDYPVFRPTKRITKDTPLTPDEIKPSNLRKQILLKQEIQGEQNLPPFEGKGLRDFSDPDKAYKKLKDYAPELDLFLSDKKNKKYFIINPKTNKKVYFGSMGYEDHTKHNDPIRRNNYLRRSANIKGDWKEDKYSPNNLARNVLW